MKFFFQVAVLILDAYHHSRQKKEEAKAKVHYLYIKLWAELCKSELHTKNIVLRTIFQNRLSFGQSYKSQLHQKIYKKKLYFH